MPNSIMVWRLLRYDELQLEQLERWLALRQRVFAPGDDKACSRIGRVVVSDSKNIS